MLKKLFKVFDLDSLIDHFARFIELKIELIKIEMQESLSRAIGQLLIAMMAALFICFAILMISIGAAEVLNQYFQSIWLGYFMIAGIYLVCFILLILLKSPLKLEEKIEQRITNLMGINGQDGSTEGKAKNTRRKRTETSH